MSKAIFAEAGDTFFTHSNSLLGGLIRWGERDKVNGKEEPSWANHTGVVVESGWIGEPHPDELQQTKAVVVEALWKTRKGPLKLNGTKVRVFRPIPPYSYSDLITFKYIAEESVGNRYGWWKLIGFLLKRATKGKIDVTQFYFIKGRPICSFLAANINDAARPIGSIVTINYYQVHWPGFGMKPNAADPDEMMDFCEMHPQYWEFVGEVGE